MFASLLRFREATKETQYIYIYPGIGVWATRNLFAPMGVPGLLGPKDGSRMAPRWLQDGSRMASGTSKTLPGASKTPPRRSKTLQDPSKTPPRAAKTPTSKENQWVFNLFRVRPNRFQEGSKTLQDAPKTPPRRLQDAPRPPRRFQAAQASPKRRIL